MDAPCSEKMDAGIKPVKILMGIPPKDAAGGPPTHLPCLVDYFKRSVRFKIKTFQFGSRAGAGENFLIKIARTIVTLIKYTFIILAYRPDIIHLNSAFDKNSLLRDVPFSLLSYILRQKLFFKIHGSHYSLLKTENYFWRFLIRLYFAGCRKAGVLSSTEKGEFIERFGSKDKIIVVKNILSNKTGDTSDKTFWHKNSNSTYCVFISRIIKDKGLDDIISALPLILQKFPNFYLVAAGDGPEKNNCRALAEKLGVSGSIIWTGYIDNNDIPSLLKQGDIFIFPTHFPEGMPMVLLEALRSGIPVITTRVRLANDYLKENENCLFIEAGNADDILQKVSTLIKDNELIKKMRQNNPKIIIQFSQETVGKEFENIYNDLLL